MADAVKLEYRSNERGYIAIITLDREEKLNAMTQDQYLQLSLYMREIALRDDVYITVLTGKGRFFSAGADVSIPQAGADADRNETYRTGLRSFAPNNLDLGEAFYCHPKILVVALNGPAIGPSAAMTGWADFVYATPHAFILTPFSSLGLVSEGAASIGFVQRTGITTANEALIMSKRITCDELVQCGYVNKVFDTLPREQEKFLGLVLQEVQDRLGPHLVPESLIKIKALMRKPQREILAAQNVAELYGAMDTWMKGLSQEEFRKLASKEKRHKL